MTSSAFAEVDPYLAGKPMTYFLHPSLTKEKLVVFLERNGASQACLDGAIRNLGGMLVKLLQEHDQKILAFSNRAGYVKPVHANQGESSKKSDGVVFRTETTQDYEDDVGTSGVPSESLHSAFANGSLKNEGLVDLNYQESSM